MSVEMDDVRRPHLHQEGDAMRLRSKVRTLGPIRCEFVEPDPRKYRWRTWESAPGAWSWEVEVWTFVRPRPVSPGPLYGWKQLASGGPEPVAILAGGGGPAPAAPLGAPDREGRA